MDERQARDILVALEGIHRMQESVRGTELDIVVDTGLIFIRLNYEKLPRNIARRLTQLEPEALAEAAGAVGEKSTPERRRALADRLASDAAFAQVIRAVNTYREKLGYELLGPDGNPEPEGGDI